MEEEHVTQTETPLEQSEVQVEQGSELVRINALKYTISKAIQESRLSTYTINAVLKEFCTESNIILEQETRQELEAYENMMSNKQSN